MKPELELGVRDDDASGGRVRAAIEIEGETPIPDNARSLGSKDLAAPRPGDILIVPRSGFSKSSRWIALSNSSADSPASW